MTISNTIRTAGPFIGNGIATAFPFTFKIFKSAEILAVRTDLGTGITTPLVINSDYTVSMNADQDELPGGTVTTSSPLASGQTLVLTSQLDYLQPIDITNGGGFYPAVLNAALDRLTIFCQQLFSLASRSLKLPLSDIAMNTELPNATARANKLLGFDGFGNPVVAAPASGSASQVALDLATAKAQYAAAGGSALIGYGQNSAQAALDGARALTFYGTNQAALLALLTYAKTSGAPVRLNRNVTLTSDLIIDMAGARLQLDFAGYCVYTDSSRLGILNPGQNSRIDQPDMRTITAPWVITRWDSNGNWLPDNQIIGTLTQTNAPGYYQPSVNDGSVYDALTPAQKNQNISALLYVYGATGLLVKNPRGLYCLYEFDMCNHTEVVDPQILCGGKGTYGTILFKNLETTGYGVGNYVTGGYVHYGSFSGVCFMRNKLGGASQISPYRTGESGVKFYQNEVGGRSARCYNMKMLDIDSYQTVYDGHDYNSDFGTPAERVDDYTLAQYPWNQLPTRHMISNVRAVGCNGVGIWGDGQFNQYSDVHSESCRKAGVYLRTTNSELDNPVVIDCNLLGGQHQIICEGGANRINSPKTHTSAAVPDGFAIYCTVPTTVVNDEICTGTQVANQIYRANRTGNNFTLGNSDITQTFVSVLGKPRADFVLNPCGELRFIQTDGTPGVEQGAVALLAVDGGAPRARGVLAAPGQGGHAQMGAMDVFNGGLLNVGCAAFYEQGGVLRLGYKKLDGTVINVGFTV